MATKRARNVRIKEPPILFAQTQKLVARIEEELRGVVITYWNNPRGSICHNDAIGLFEVLERIKNPKVIYLFVKSDGGSGEAALRMVNLIRQHCARLVALVPLECASAATMLTLGANEIQMGPLAYLTAVDSSLTHDLSPIDRDNDRVSVSLDEVRRVVRLWRNEKNTSAENPYAQLFNHVHPLVVGAVDRASSLSVMLSRELLGYHMKSSKKIKQIADALNTHYPSHSYPILPDEARRLGLNVKPIRREVNTLLLELNELYSEMGQKAVTDFDEKRSHVNETTNVLEARGVQVYYRLDKDWFYRSEERRWDTMHDHSGYRKTELRDGRPVSGVLHIA